MKPQEIGQIITDITQLGASVSVNWDFRDVDTVSASTLSKLVLLHRNLRPLGGRIILRNLGPFISEVFHATHLDRIFDIYSEVDGPVRPPSAKENQPPSCRSSIPP